MERPTTYLRIVILRMGRALSRVENSKISFNELYNETQVFSCIHSFALVSFIIFLSPHLCFSVRPRKKTLRRVVLVEQYNKGVLLVSVSGLS